MDLFFGMVCFGIVGLFFCATMYVRFIAWPALLEDHRQSWQTTADTLGLTTDVSGPPEHWTMQGVVSGLEVHLRNEDVEDGVFTEFEVWYPLPLVGLLQIQMSSLEVFQNGLNPDIQVGIPDFDLRFRVQSTAPTLLQALFSDDRVHDWACGYSDSPHDQRLESRGIYRTLRTFQKRSPDTLEDTIHECVSLANLFTDALDRFCDRLTSRTGLSKVSGIARNLPPFAGTRDGVHIDLRQPATGDGLQLTATPATPVEPTLTIVAQQADNASLTGARVPMLDPILDAHVHVSTKQPDATRALLTRDQTREDILALMMAHPNARVHNGTVTLLVPTVDPDTVAAALDDVVALAASLSTPRAGEVSRAGATAVAKAVR